VKIGKAVFALVLTLFLMATVQAIEINPGDVRNFNCTENCQNGTLQVECANCPSCNVTNQTCGVCSIDRTLSWNETYTNNQTPCDLNIRCEAFNLTQMGKVNFPTRIKVKKDAGNFLLSIDVYDRYNNPMETWNKQISEEDVVEYTYEFNYTCPAELTTDVNIETCSPFLESVFNTSNPMVFQMVTGQTLCMKNLVECQSKMEARSDVAHIWEQRYNLLLDQYNDMEDLYNQCYLNMDYSNRNGTLYKAVRATENKYYGWVPGIYAIGFWVLLVILILIGAFMFFGGGVE